MRFGILFIVTKGEKMCNNAVAWGLLWSYFNGGMLCFLISLFSIIKEFLYHEWSQIFMAGLFTGRWHHKELGACFLQFCRTNITYKNIKLLMLVNVSISRKAPLIHWCGIHDDVTLVSWSYCWHDWFLW